MTSHVTCEDIKGQTYQVAIEELSFRPAVYGIIVEDDKVLLSKQWDGYDFPGGGIKLGESTRQALLREVKEETGLEVKVGQVLHCADSFFKLPFKGDYVHSIHMYYQCQVVGGELSTQFLDMQEKKYVSEPEWVKLKEVGQLKIYTSAKVEEVLEKFYET